jgi:hypothetical protein
MSSAIIDIIRSLTSRKMLARLSWRPPQHPLGTHLGNVSPIDHGGLRAEFH